MSLLSLSTVCASNSSSCVSTRQEELETVSIEGKQLWTIVYVKELFPEVEDEKENSIKIATNPEIQIQEIAVMVREAEIMESMQFL